jgi:translation initiation factor IF-3
VPFSKAFELAKNEGLDIVLVADNATPPVCRIMNFGKFLYEQRKKEKEQRKAQHTQKMKEVKFSANIDPHDYQIKLRHSVEFLEKGCKVKAVMMFKGRQLSHKEIGFDIMKKVVKDLENIGIPEAAPKLIGRSIILNFNPGHSKH